MTVKCFLLLSIILCAVPALHTAPAELQPIVAEMRKAGISMIGAVACDPGDYTLTFAG
jgi:hypothetical protein